MSKKLLEEQAVRKFMKIAGLQPLTNSFLKESEEAELEEAYSADDATVDEHRRRAARRAERADAQDFASKQKDAADKKKGAHDKIKDEAEADQKKHGGRLGESEKLEEEVEDLEEGKEELEEGGGQMPFDQESRRSDERAREDRVNEAKALVGKVKTKGGAKMSPAKKSTKNGSSGKGLVKEEDMPEEGSEDVESPEMDAGPEAAPGLDVEGLVKELIRVITEKVPGAADVVSVEEEGDETEVEMGGEEEGEMEGGEEELDEAALEKVVAETVKRVKARLMESKNPKAVVSKEALAKKVAAKVAERLKKA